MAGLLAPTMGRWALCPAPEWVDSVGMTRGRSRLALFAAFVLTPVTLATSAQAHGDDESQEGYVLVQQALAHLAHGTGHEAVDDAMEKVDDAIQAEDQEGVDVAEVQQGMTALEAGRIDEARTLLQDSIADAFVGRPLATGYETGTTAVPPRLDGRGSLGSGDWLVLGLCASVTGIGVWLSTRFRPHESVSALRLLLGTNPDAAELPRRRIGIRRHQP